MGFGFKSFFRPIIRPVKKIAKTVTKPVQSIVKSSMPEMPEMPEVPTPPEPPKPEAAGAVASAMAKTMAEKKGRASTILAGGATTPQAQEQIRRRKLLGGYSEQTGA